MLAQSLQKAVLAVTFMVFSVPFSSRALLLSLCFFAPCCSSLSLEESSSSKRNVERIFQRILPGIWKLSTESLPYELDIRSKLNKRFAQEPTESGSSNQNSYGYDDEILIKLNKDGTFKQCDEGYREGRWVTGRWKLEMIDQEDMSEIECEKEHKSTCVLLRLAMNRQYFGPPYDVLLEAKSIVRDGATKIDANGQRGPVRDNKVGQSRTISREESVKVWRGTVQKGKFLRPSTGEHPFDAQVSPSSNLSTNDGTENDSISNTDILVDPERLGTFSLEQALTSSSIARISSLLQRGNYNQVDDNNHDKTFQISSESVLDEIDQNEGDGDDTFFLPHLSSDDGVLQ
eukprot:jgi/Psemu1/40197/gm1.40197_g